MGRDGDVCMSDAWRVNERRVSCPVAPLSMGKVNKVQKGSISMARSRRAGYCREKKKEGRLKCDYDAWHSRDCKTSVCSVFDAKSQRDCN